MKPMKPTKVDAYMAEDGTLFVTYHECEMYNRRRSFELWYCDNSIIDYTFEEFVAWLDRNASEVLTYLSPEEES